MARLTEQQIQAELDRRKTLLKTYMSSGDYTEKMIQRVELASAGMKSAESRSYIWHLCERFDNPAEGAIFFIENFGWTFNPRSEPSHFPFILYEYQKEAIRKMVDNILNGKDLFIEKSRDMGATWLFFVYVPLWFWLFRDGTSFLVGSYKEALVDNRCYTDDTEVLTKDGWKLFQDTDIEKDLFATRSIDKKFEWQKASDKTYQDYEGDVYNLKSRTMDLTVSPNHRVLHSKFWSEKETILKAKELYGKDGVCVPATSSWVGEKIDNFILPQKDKKDRGIKMSGDDYCAFMGAYIAEGCRVPSKNGIVIYQQNYSKGFDAYSVLLNRILGKSYYHDRSWNFGNKQLCAYLEQFGKSYEKFIPEEIINAPKEQLEIFLYYYMLGDGSWGGAMPSMSTTSKKLAGQLQELIQKIGKSASVSTVAPREGQGIGDRKFKSTKTSYILRIRKSKYQKVGITKTKYKGKIACVTVPNTILYVRRNGKPAWSGNTDGSIFGKLDYAILSLPKWMLPDKFNFKKHRNKLKLVNPVNNNLIDGDTMNPRFGRGMRKTAILFDELGFWDYAKDAWESAGDSTNCRIANSTPSGYNYYGMLRDTGIDIITMHWSQHPLKDQGWYDFEKNRRTDEEVAQEIDISYSRSNEGKVYEQWNNENVKKGMYRYDDRLPLYVSWDFGKSDDTAIIWSQRTTDGKLRIIDTYYNSGKNIDFYVPFIHGYQMSDSYNYNKNDKEVIDAHKEYKKAIHFGDPAGRFQNAVSDETVFSVLKDHGIVINFKENWKHFSLRKSATKRLIMDGVELDKNPRNDYFNICILNASYPKTKVDGVNAVKSVLPKHDNTSHYRTSLEYLAMGLEDMPHKGTMKPHDKFNFSSRKLERGARRRTIGY